MISELLDLTRIEAGGLALAHETVALRALTAQTLEMMHTQADAVGVTLALQPAAGDAPPDDEVLACGDTTRLRQVLLNLLGNAIKYNRRGGQVWVSLSTAVPCSVQLMVADTGMGIAAAELPHVFEPFRRGRHVRSDIDGAGIGLAVTQALVQAMGGHIEASSREGEGSRFVVTLPAAPPTPPPSVPAP
jgi:signal transduction histidine kinase